jgi:transposase
VAMEATGIYSMPVYHALVEHGDFEKVLVCNAGHVKNVPGRKTDFSDAEWLVHLLECGLLAGGFIPPAEIKAARDVLRYRTKVAQQRVSEIARLGNVLQDALLTELPDVSAAQMRRSSQQPIAEMSGRCGLPGCCSLAASLRVTETGHTRRNQSPAFSSLPILDVSRGGPQALLQCP